MVVKEHNSQLIRPLVVGDLTLTTNLIQGPLAGYSCAAMRKLTWQFGGVAYCTTEMLSAYSLAHVKQQPLRYVHRDASEKVVCAQISGNKADMLMAATERMVSLGYDLIDLNCGCPQPKIRKKVHGSRLLEDPEQLYQLVKAIRGVCAVPLSVKIRVDSDSGEQFNHEVATAVESAGADMLIVHGRHWRERYDTPCQTEDIRQIVATVNIPVIANGDGGDYDSVMRLLQSTGAAGVMISRAAMGQPWLFAQICLQDRGEDYVTPSLQERKQLLLQHIDGLIQLDGEYQALLHMRKLWRYYAIPLPAVEWSALMQYKSVQSLLSQ